jgi:uncharacterized protein (UPF0264 family)
MTGLLVSVRSREEAEIACRGGADLVDVKEPSRGALGAAEPEVWRDIAEGLAGRLPSSVALGELFDRPHCPAEDELQGFQYAKLGLAGGRLVDDWPQHWECHLSRLPASIIPVAVVYADWRDAQAPTPDDVVYHAMRLGCGAVLFDTFRKGQGNLLERMGLDELTRLSRFLRASGLRVVFGGSLGEESIPSVLSLQPDYVAVRGAACRQGRNGTVDLMLVRRLAALVHGQ